MQFPHYSWYCYLMAASKMEAHKGGKYVPAVSVLVPLPHRLIRMEIQTVGIVFQ